MVPAPARPCTRSKDVSFDIRRGETLGLVGESGSGKSTVGALVHAADRAGSAAAIRLGGADLARRAAAPLRPRARRIQMVFQDPFASLNPRRTVGRSHRRRADRARHAAAEALGARRANCWTLVGLDPRAATAIRTSSPAVSASASASPGRWRSSRRARGRRAGLGARRLGAGAGARAAGDSRRGCGSPCCSSPTT